MTRICFCDKGYLRDNDVITQGFMGYFTEGMLDDETDKENHQ